MSRLGTESRDCDVTFASTECCFVYSLGLVYRSMILTKNKLGCPWYIQKTVGALHIAHPTPSMLPPEARTEIQPQRIRQIRQR
jgi:hypothetical protein